MVIATWNTVKMTHITIVSLLVGSYRKLNNGDSLKECSKAATIHSERPLRGFFHELSHGTSSGNAVKHTQTTNRVFFKVGPL
jgi:hypothetical protein